MTPPRVTQQTTTVPVGVSSRSAPRPHQLPHGSFSGVVQRLLEDSGWTATRLAVDFAMLSLALVVALDGLSLTAPGAPLILMPPLAVAMLFLRGLYRTRMRPLVLDGVLPVLSAVSVAAMTIAMIGFFVHGQILSQSIWLRTWLFSLAGVGLGRIALMRGQRWARKRYLIGKPVLIVGAGLVGSQVARRLQAHPEYGLVPVGFIDDEPLSVAAVGGRDIPVLGTLEQVDRIVERTHADHMIVAFSSIADARLARLIQHSQELGVDVAVVPRMFDTMNHRAAYETVGGLPLLSFAVVDPKGWQFDVKDALDRIAALLILLVLSPVLAVLALAVRVGSPGPILFRQRRVGRDGSVFDLYKFRSMSPPPVAAAAASSQSASSNSDAERGEATSNGKGAPPAVTTLARDIAPGGVEGADRRTRVGRLMRRTSLDELPQLLNVLKGDMSIVGPRPERPEFVELFDQDVNRYGDRHRVKSGITGWAQVHGLRGQTSLAERIELDNYYIAHWSLGLDLKILLLTVTALLRNAE